jgi:hypothetical protein
MKKGQPAHQLSYTGARALLCAVIEQAVHDFKALAAAGRIVNGKVTPGNGQRVVGYRTDVEVQALLDFFSGDVMDEWIHFAGIRINPTLIREKLGIQKRSSTSTVRTIQHRPKILPLPAGLPSVASERRMGDGRGEGESFGRECRAVRGAGYDYCKNF